VNPVDADRAAGGGRVWLGAWRCPSSNGVDVFLLGTEGSEVRYLQFEWDSPPPLAARDALFYRAVIRPAAIWHAAEYLERPVGRGVVVEL
jgi:hypothetical protein